MKHPTLTSTRPLSALMIVALMPVLVASCGAGSLQGGADHASDLPPDIREVPTVNDVPPDSGLHDEGDAPLQDFGSRPRGFLEPCETNAECEAGFCVGHMGEHVCTMACYDACPQGWKCRQVQGLGGDSAYVCLSTFWALCQPCGDNSDCKSPQGEQDQCVSYAAVGSFCGGACERTEDCPKGYGCALSTSVTGLQTWQCVLLDGECPCPGAFLEAGIETVCSVTNTAGTCHGKRHCTDEGLSDCDAPEAAVEVCDLKDNDCDGSTDEGFPGCCVCGNGTCESQCESMETCAVDCAKQCGNLECEVTESPLNCPEDCCGGCGDGRCTGYSCGESPATCPADCGTACGDQVCGKGETPQSCAMDCDWQVCGNRVCEPGDGGAEKCPIDCAATCGDCVCEGTEDWLTCPVDCGYCGDGVCSPCPDRGEGLATCPKDCAQGVEVCNGKDDDGDGETDEEDATGCLPYRHDADGDGYGVVDLKCLCQASGKFTSSTGDDCNDQDAAVHPGMQETCNELDDDCDGSVDEPFLLDGKYLDIHHCGACGHDCDLQIHFAKTAACDPVPGTPSCIVLECQPGYVPSGLAACVPAESHLCEPCLGDASCGEGGSLCLDGLDGRFCGQDCAEGAAFGTQCPDGFECEDVQGGARQCRPKSGSCDCTPGNEGESRSCHVSNEFGTCTGAQSCDPQLGWSMCTAKTPVQETCNGLDDDCDGSTDAGFDDLDKDGIADCVDCDIDGDDLPNPNPGCETFTVIDNCLFVPNADQADLDLDLSGDACDCDIDGDGIGNMNPDCPEPEPLDNCIVMANPSQEDLDGDKTGDVCDEDIDGDLDPNSSDCKPLDPAISTNATEVCDEIDNDCDGQIDEVDALGCSKFYLDADGDGWGSTQNKCLCGVEGKYTAVQSGDCDDSDKASNPGAREICNNSKDDNCNGTIDEENAEGCIVFYRDQDKDGFGLTDDHRCLCVPDASAFYTATTTGDCNDADKFVKPGGGEICNGMDDNCDQEIDEENAQGCSTFYLDNDSDGYGVGTSPKCLCTSKDPYDAVKIGDCVDDNEAINTSATEVCDGIDNDCDGATDEEGAVCVPVDPCMAGATCVAGQCVGGIPNQWQTTYGGATVDDAKAIVRLDDGSLAAAGRMQTANGNGMDALVARLDASGKVLWTRTYGGYADDEAAGLVATADGGLVFAGHTWSMIGGVATSWLVKVDGAGNKLWEVYHASGAGNWTQALALRPNGGYALAGRAVADGIVRPLLLLTSPNGGSILEHAYGGAEGGGRAYAIAALPDGGYALAGDSLTKDFLLIRTDASGALLWQSTYGGPNDEVAYGITVLADGGFALAGVTNSFGLGGTDIWLLRTDSTGRELWTATLGGPSNDAAWSIVAQPNGGFFLAGTTTSTSGLGDQGWLAGVSALGVQSWSRTIGGTGDNCLRGVVTVPGGLVVAGYGNSEETGSVDAWLVRVDAWGNQNCAESGPCAAKLPADCDDENPCTADGCSSVAGGCKHEALPAGTQCGGGLVCSQAGECGPSSTEASVPAGSFWMGCNKEVDVQCNNNEYPQHEVYLSAYLIDINEVSAAEYQACEAAKASGSPIGCAPAGTQDSACNAGRSDRESHPANCLDWQAAFTYCNWAGKRLPTEAEWEKAGRGGCEKACPTGEPQCCAKNEPKYPWGSQNATPTMANYWNNVGTTRVVGSYPAGGSPYGVLDMAGNVAEYVSDWYGATYYSLVPGTCTNPKGPQSGPYHFTRGGCYSDDDAHVRVSNRTDSPVAGSPKVGFRCARSIR